MTAQILALPAPKRLQLKRENIRVGQHITIVSRGIRHSPYGPDYVNSDQVGSSAFMTVSKIGRDYVYGKHYRVENGKREVFYWEDKIKLSEYLVFDGEVNDYEALHLAYRKSVNDYEETRHKAEYEYDHEAYEAKRKWWAEWEIAHPRPKIVSLEA